MLDLGCGYGPLGLWLAAAEPAPHASLAVDRDARAVAATGLGAAAQRPGGPGARSRGSLGYDDVGDEPLRPRGLEHPGQDRRRRPRPPAARRRPPRSPPAASSPWWWSTASPARWPSASGDAAVEVLATYPDRRPTRSSCTASRPSRRRRRTEPGFERGVYRRGRATFAAGALDVGGRRRPTRSREFDSSATAPSPPSSCSPPGPTRRRDGRSASGRVTSPSPCAPAATTAACGSSTATCSPCAPPRPTCRRAAPSSATVPASRPS